MESTTTMGLSCPKGSCSSACQSCEELLDGQEKNHPSVEVTAQKAATETASDGIADSSLGGSSNIDVNILEKSDMTSSLGKHQRKDAPEDHRDESSNYSVSPQNGTQPEKSPALPRNIPAEDTEAKACEERVHEQQPSRGYEPLPKGMCPRPFETASRIRSMELRNLENGLKDLSLNELLGDSSSEKGSDDGESNYSW